MHADEIHTDVPLVRRLLAAQFPEWSALPLERVRSSGTDNALYRVGDEMVVRLPRIHWAVDQVDKEFRWLPALAPLLPVEIPKPLAKGAPAEGYPWTWGVYGWLEGENPRVDDIDDPAALAREVAAFVRALQRVELPDAPRASRGVPLAQRDAATRRAIAELEGMIDTDAATAAWAAALRIPAWSRPPVWVHGDVAPGNLLLRGGRLAAVIDFAGAGVGDPACDLIVAWNLLPTGARDVFRAELGVDDATWSRGRGWGLWKALIVLVGQLEHGEPEAAESRRVIGEILADHAHER
jgi:aminoglycoside phosphotransferase (APT) family kinase protein